MTTNVSGSGTGALLTSLDLLNREDIPVLFRKRGYNRMPFFMELFAMNMESVVQSAVAGGMPGGEAMNQDIFYHWEDLGFKQLMQFEEDATAGSAGADKTLRIKQSLITNSTIPFRLNDTLLFPGMVSAFIKTITVNSSTDIDIVVRPFNSASAIPAVTAATTFVGVLGDAWSRASGQPTALAPQQEKFSHRFQIIKDTARIEGSLIAEAIRVTKDNSGRPLNGFWTENTLHSEYRQFCAISDTLLFQELNTNTVVDVSNSNATLATTEGFFPHLLARGYEYPFTVGSLDITDFNAIVRYLDGQRCGAFTYCKLGIGVYQEIEDLLNTYFANQNLASVIESISDHIPGMRTLEGSATFTSLVKSGHKFLFSKFEELSDVETYNYAGSEYVNFGAFFPMGYTADPNTRMQNPIIGYRYKSGNGYSRKMEIWEEGAAGGQATMPYTGSIDQRSYYMRSEIGSDFKLGNKCVFLNPA